MLVTQHNIDVVCSRIMADPYRGIDTETTGLEETDLPFAVIIAIEGEVFYFDERALPGFWDHPKFRFMFTDKGTWFYQHAKFDMRMVWSKSGIVPRRVFDIAVMARIVKNDLLSYSLADQAARIGHMKKGDFIKGYIKQNNLYSTRKDYFGVEYQNPQYDWVPMEIMQDYAETDAVITRACGMHYLQLMDLDDKKLMEWESLLTPVLFRMERHGVLVDEKYTLEAYYHELGELNKLKDTFHGLAGIAFVNHAKTIQKALTVSLPVTAAGNPSLTDDTIEEFLNDATTPQVDKEVMSLVREIRYLDKRISTYYVPFLNRMDKDKLIHCTFWQGGTRTGRFSSSEPNLQNVPKEEDSTGPYVVRGCFVPHPGNVFVSMDYSQMEYRMMAAYAGQHDIIKRVMAGEDFHKATAEMFGVSRKTAKTLNFAILYGAGDKKLAAMLGVSIGEAKLLKLKYFLALPKVETLVDQVIRTGKHRGYVKNWAGRKLRADFHHCYALPNHLIQGGGADVVKQAMVLIDREFPNVKMVLQIHDQLVFDMPPSQFVHIPRIKEIMENIWEMAGMKLEVDVSWSARSLAERDMQKGIPDGSNSVQTV